MSIYVYNIHINIGSCQINAQSSQQKLNIKCFTETIMKPSVYNLFQRLMLVSPPPPHNYNIPSSPIARTT